MLIPLWFPRSIVKTPSLLGRHPWLLLEPKPIALTDSNSTEHFMFSLAHSASRRTSACLNVLVVFSSLEKSSCVASNFGSKLDKKHLWRQILWKLNVTYCFVVPVLFWHRPRCFFVASFGGGATEGSTHLLWQIPHTLHQEACSQFSQRQLEAYMTGKIDGTLRKRTFLKFAHLGLPLVFLFGVCNTENRVATAW